MQMHVMIVCSSRVCVLLERRGLTDKSSPFQLKGVYVTSTLTVHQVRGVVPKFLAVASFLDLHC